MQGERHLFLLTCMVALAITVSLAFNIDMKNTDVYPGEKEDFYGYKVVQFESGVTKGIVISAPLGLNGSGEICKHEINSTKWCFSNTGITQEDKIIPVKFLGLSIAADSTQSQLTVCSPSVAHECNENSYLNSVCYQITDDFQPVSSFTPDFQECTKKTVDLVFLFDGSASMTEDEFTQNKVFIVDIMNSLKNSSIKFAAVQFATEHRKVFDFKDYEAGRAHDKLTAEPHMKKLTNTHAALTFVMDEILENPDAGASPDATKVLVLITDGDPSDVDRNNIIKRYDDKNIIRFVIGVKVATLDKFRAIASEPSEKYAFKIQHYNGLTDILENFQKKIFNMEGSSVARAGDLTGEMSQSGFSAIYYKDKLILGSVGSNNWKGSLQELHDTSSGAPKHGYGRSFPPNKTQVTTEPKRLNQVTSIRDGNMQNDSYMGYSVSVGQKNDAPLYFAGAPRFEHRGQVVLFRHNGNWITAQRLDGDQIGSYFGAELCSVDINSDGNTDFLLVGAPLFYHPQEKREGQIYVYTLTDEMQLRSQLNVTVPSMGRFGTTISSLADLNGDGLRDVAVGAPLEDDNRGAVYIYLGDRKNGIRGSFSQRIMGKEISPWLRFFGQAIDGGMDLGKDGLPDIVIGSQGAAVVLRSRPVFDVKPRLSFLPKEISIDSFNCLAKEDKNLPLVTITTCFKVKETTKSGAVAKGEHVTISYTLNVDPMRQTSRGFFAEIEKARTYTNSNMLTKETCHNHTIFMPRCVKDTLSPLIVKLNYSQVNSENESAILNMDSRGHATVEIPFEKQCAQKETCIADIEVDFNFTTPVLLVSEDNYFNLTVTLSNHGDDSYNTSLTLYYPQGLSFSRMTQLRTESSRQTLHSCHDLEGVFDKTICGISLPVYRSRSAATFTVSFYMTDYEWNDTVSVAVTGKSDNSNMTKRSSQTKFIPVQFDVKLAITVIQDTATYLNFTTEDDKPKKLVTVYKIDNPGLKAFPVTVSLLFPTLLEYDFELSNYQVSIQENKTQCNITNEISEYCLPEKSCKLIQCDYFTLDKESTTEFTLSGDVQFKHLKAYAEKIPFLKRYTGDSGEVRFRSFVKVWYDEKRYTLSAHKQGNADDSAQEQSGETGIWRDNGHMKSADIRVEFIIPADQLLIICTGVGVGFLLLVIITIIMVKLGCFRRRFRSEQELRSLQSASSTKSIKQSVADSKSDCEKKAPENEVLLDDGQTNGSKPPADTEEALE